MHGPYGYFPGCSLKGTGVAYEESVLALFRLLELPLAELEDWNCCGATSYMSIDERSAFSLAARNLVLANRAGNGDLMAPCSACYLVLRKAQDYIQRYPGIAGKIGELTDVHSVAIRYVYVHLLVQVTSMLAKQSQALLFPRPCTSSICSMGVMPAMGSLLNWPMR